MNYLDMHVANVKDGGVKAVAFEREVTLSSAGNSVWILVPDDVQQISVTVIPTSGASAKVQTTIDPIAVVKSGAGITPVDWDAGLITETTQDVASPITAFRLVQSGAGNTKMTARAQ